MPVAVRTMMVWNPESCRYAIGCRTHHPAPGILSRGGAGKDRAGRRHDLDGCRFQNAGDRPRAAHVVEKLNQGRGSRQPSTVCIHAGNVYFVRIFIVLPEVHNFVRCALLQAVSCNAHAADAARRQNRALHVAGIGLARDLFDDPSQKAVAEVRESPVLSGWIGERQVLQCPADQLGLVQELLLYIGSFASAGQPPQVWVRRWSTVISVTYCP